MKREWLVALGMACALVGGMSPAAAQTVYTGGTYAQNFDSLASAGTNATWTDNVTLEGWYSTNSAYLISHGNHTGANLYSFGTNDGTPSPERALGSIASNASGNILYALRIRNSTGTTLNSIQLAYRGEQWRNGGNTTPQGLAVAISTNATGLAVGTYLNQAHLGFTGPVAATGGGALDGNTNSVAVSGSVAGLNWADGTDLWIRWTDTNDAGTDHALAIDDLNFSASADAPAVPEPGGFTLLLPALFAMALLLRRPRQPARVALTPRQ